MQIDKVIWREGMLLRPQHLQHNDRYYHQQLNRSRLLSRDGWGFLTLDIDVQYLNLGKLVVNQASGVFPDGSLFELNNTMPPLVLQVPADTAGQAVFLALPLAIGNQLDVRQPEQSDVLARYVSYETQIADSNVGMNAHCQIHCARPDLHLQLGEQPSDSLHVKLQVAQVLDSTREAGVQLDADFVPTFIYVQSAGYVSSCVKEVVSLLAARGDAIAARVQGNGGSAGAQLGDFLMLQLINRTEVLLRHYLSQSQVRPEAVYRVLLSILGELSTFAVDDKRAQVEGCYRHGDQGGELSWANGRYSQGAVSGAGTARHRTPAGSTAIRGAGVPRKRSEIVGRGNLHSGGNRPLRFGRTAPPFARASQGWTG